MYLSFTQLSSVMSNEAKTSRPRPRPELRGRGRGQFLEVETKAGAKIIAGKINEIPEFLHDFCPKMPD